ncbi:hypothetical protein ACQKWADRAFT_327391 [Trichoderma austrokoningii]
MKSGLIKFATAISLAAIPGALSQCFLPDGQPADSYGFNFEPCNGRNTTWQQCCFPGDVCTANGICMHSDGNVTDTFSYRGGCVNADWSGCAHACLERSSHDKTLVTQCDAGKFCCYSHLLDDCCDDETQQFSLSSYNPGAKNKKEAAKRVTIGAAVGGAVGGIAMIGGAVGVWLYLRKKGVKQEREEVAQGEMKQVLELGTDSKAEHKGTSEVDMKDQPTAVFELGA